MEAVIAKYREKTPASSALLAQLPTLIDKKYHCCYLDYGTSSQTPFLNMCSLLESDPPLSLTFTLTLSNTIKAISTRSSSSRSFTLSSRISKVDQLLQRSISLRFPCRPGEQKLLLRATQDHMQISARVQVG